MSYKYETQYNSPNRTVGRQGNKSQFLVIHWWGDPATNPTYEGVVNWLCNPNAQTSAHFVATGTGRRVAHLVELNDTAWHAGTWIANLQSIGIELDPRCCDEDYDVAAELIADLWSYYGYLPLKRHSDIVKTRCPGNYDLARLEREAMVKLPYAKLTSDFGQIQMPAPAPVEQPKP